MALSLNELNDRLDRLQRIRSSPVRRVRFADGTELVYDSPADLANEIAATEAQIAEMQGATAPQRFFRVGMSNGLR